MFSFLKIIIKIFLLYTHDVMALSPDINLALVYDPTAFIYL